MADKPKPSMVKVLELCRVSPKPNLNTTISPSLPLTFLDIPWLLFPPSQPIFFYEYPLFDSTAGLETLKRSLSLALGVFYPLAGTLVLPPPQTRKPAILCSSADSVSFAVAESDGDFDFLSSHFLQRDAQEFHKLVPRLNDDDDCQVLPLLAVQVTVFPKAGFCLGLAIHHVVADARTFNNFMRVWSSFCSQDCSSLVVDRSLRPCFDRTVIVEPHELAAVFMDELRRMKKSSSLPPRAILETDIISISTDNNVVRATFLLGPGEMERVKSRIVISQFQKRSEPQSLHLSPYVLTCSLVWVCLVKAQGQKGPQTDPNYFGFIAGGLTRVGFPVPSGYFGNCVGFGRAAATRGELLGEDGILVAARAIGSTIKRLDKVMLGGAEKWISEWEGLVGSSVHVVVSGSPKVDLYGRDFGWGRPKKIEEVEIDSIKAISLSESRDVKGGIEIGLVLPKSEMDSFTIYFKECIEALCSLKI